MIVLDSSAVLASMFGEPGAQPIANLLASGEPLSMSVANAFECFMRLARISDERASDLDLFVRTYDITLHNVDGAQLALARAAFLAYGKGRHAAALNFGDCFAYALAKSREAPLLFVGEDFAKTDVKRAL